MFRQLFMPRGIRALAPMLAWMTARYISSQRMRLIGDAVPIDLNTQSKLRGFFADGALSETRIVRAAVPEPRFYPIVRMLRIPGLLEMSTIDAITLVDVVAYPEQLDLSTLFHELVHVVQYRVLGLKRFAELYVKGFLRGGGYDGIPLERQAYELSERFEKNPRQVFGVEDEVIRRHRFGLL
jgi:hypothetical protein